MKRHADLSAATPPGSNRDPGLGPAPAEASVAQQRDTAVSAKMVGAG